MGRDWLLTSGLIGRGAYLEKSRFRRREHNRGRKQELATPEFESTPLRRLADDIDSIHNLAGKAVQGTIPV